MSNYLTFVTEARSEVEAYILIRLDGQKLGHVVLINSSPKLYSWGLSDLIQLDNALEVGNSTSLERAKFDLLNAYKKHYKQNLP